jgi:hypothetical protein
MRGKIDQVKDSTSGKTLSVLIGNQWYSSKSWEFRQMVGQTIEFEPSTSEWQGKTMHWINDYGVVQPTAADAMAAAMPQNIPPTPPVEAYQEHQTAAGHIPQQPPAAPQTALKDRDASIVAQALTKACTAPGDDPELVWSRYTTFYYKYVGWDCSVPF